MWRVYDVFLQISVVCILVHIMSLCPENIGSLIIALTFSIDSRNLTLFVVQLVKAIGYLSRRPDFKSAPARTIRTLVGCVLQDLRCLRPAVL